MTTSASDDSQRHIRMAQKRISGFSKLSKEEKLEWVTEHFFDDSAAAESTIKSFYHRDDAAQKMLDGISENTLTNYFLPYSVAPNFVINDKTYTVPMAIEESSVVAAAASAAKFWSTRGGFQAEVLGTVKVGQVHFLWTGDEEILKQSFEVIKQQMLDDTAHITKRMCERGGGIMSIELLDKAEIEAGYFQIHARFETCDSMGANFINSNLEAFAETLRKWGSEQQDEIEILMSILSNLTPECLVRASVSCPVEELGSFSDGMSAAHFARRFELALRIAKEDPYRATTHNKGFFNGLDAVCIATANDFRALEACGHAYAARDGQYRSLTHCKVEDGIFTFWIDFPIAIGTVGGLTKVHPLASKSLEMLGHPSAQELMCIMTCVGLAQNFGAVKSLVTTGIQHGHMKMHLANILLQLGATDEQTKQTMEHFADRVVSHSAVRDYLEMLK